jgi:hypothetical protein
LFCHNQIAITILRFIACSKHELKLYSWRWETSAKPTKELQTEYHHASLFWPPSHIF